MIFFGLSIIYPSGIGIGIAVSNAPDFVSSIVMSLAGGTFVYIACSEILVHEFENGKWLFTKFFLFIFGAAVITLLWFLDDHGAK